MFSRRFNEVIPQIIEAIPSQFEWGFDGGRLWAPHRDMNFVAFKGMAQDLRMDKHAEVFCGYFLSHDSPIVMSGELLIETTKAVTSSLAPLYRLSI